MVAAPAKSAVTGYAEAVLSGGVTAGRLVRLACERHIRDLAQGPARGLHFAEGSAAKAIRFFAGLRLHEGQWYGAPFKLEDWQCFIVGSLFGWQRVDGRRRFSYAYSEVARSNGKSPMAAGVGLYGLIADEQHGAQIYAAATTRDQAKIVFNDALHMIEATPLLSSRITHTVNNLLFDRLGSFFRPLSADASTMDGLRVLMALVDELHEHPNGEVLAKLRTGMKFAESMLFMITTAGYDRRSACWYEREGAIRVLEGLEDNDALFAYIACLDDADDWQDESAWIKANPNLGVSVRLETLQQEFALAKLIPSQENAFKRFRLNIWTEQAIRWIPLELWQKGNAAVETESLKGRLCYGGLDLAKQHDLSALILAFPPIEIGEKWKLLCRFWVPEDDITDRSHRDRVPYDVWQRQGYLRTTPGNVTDYRFIEAEIIKLAGEYNIGEIAYDRVFAEMLVQNLIDEGLTMVPFGQGFVSMGPAAAEFERLLLGGLLQHGNHPVLTWNAANVAVRMDPAGNIKPDKEASRERIDGIVAAIMAVGRGMTHGDQTSVYETRGIITTG